MSVLIGFSPGVEPWDAAQDIARTTGMKLVGVSPSTRAALYILRDETDMAQGTMAATYEEWVLTAFAGMILSYNYGPNLATPVDLQRIRPPTASPPGGRRKPPPARRFSGADRLVAMSWSDQGRRLASRLRVGMPLDPEVRSRVEPVPPELVRRLGPLPAGSRYVILGNTLVLLDSREFVQDIIRF
jgi:hypothetical protein